MQQFLHLLIVNPDRGHGLATVHGSRWLLPVVWCHERTRAGPLAARWMAERGLDGPVIGQWLGRLGAAHDAMDWLVVIAVRPEPDGAVPAAMRWMPLEHLKSSASLIDYQQWAVKKAVPNHLPLAAGPFGSMTWFDAARDWLHAVVGPLTGSPICYKATPHEVVLGIGAASGTVYFKGLTGDRVAEATLTSTLAAEFPQSFARTLALERRADDSVMWLTAHCAGTLLATDPTRERTVRVAAALGRVQSRFSSRLTTRLGIPEADLAAAEAWASALVVERTNSEIAADCARSLARVCRAVRAADLPDGWIPLDLDAGNVLIDGTSVRFIDLDRSRVGPVPLSLSMLLRRLTRVPDGSAAAQCIPESRHAYEQSWAPSLDLRERWSDFDAASLLLESHLGWQQLCQKVERGEVHGVIDFAATCTAQRLARALDAGRHTGSAQGSR